MLREYSTCWIRHQPDIPEDGTIQFVPAEMTDVPLDIERAKNYDPEVAFSLIERFCAAALSGSDIDERLLNYVVRALCELVRDNECNLSPFAQALGMKSGPHRPQKNRQRDGKIFMEVRESMFSMSLEDACFHVGETRCLSDETIKSIYKRRRLMHLEFLKDFDEFSHEVTSEQLATIRQLIDKENPEK